VLKALWVQKAISYHPIIDLKGIAIRFARHYRELVNALEALPFVKPQEYTYAFIEDRYVSGTLSLMGVFKGWE